MPAKNPLPRIIRVEIAIIILAMIFLGIALVSALLSPSQVTPLSWGVLVSQVIIIGVLTYQVSGDVRTHRKP